MSHLKNNFVVFGPGGRCGSHWVETLLKNLLGVWCTYDSFTPTPTGWIYHTNREEDLLEMPSEIRDSVTLVYCVRKNYFDVAVSKMMAEISDEWFHYTNKTIEPFVADTARFKWLIDDLQSLETKRVPENILPLFNNPITIVFDNLIKAEIPEKYVADQLGIDYVVDDKHCQPSYKNTRNYKDLILNWDELVDIYAVFLTDHHAQSKIVP
jgi:hypothetical protein